jgi:hypothetical protein
MEFDSLLINEFPKNKLIAHQLYNFNLCFNLEDIINPTILNQMIGQSCCVKVRVGTGEGNGNMFPIRDFFSNYEYIPKKEVNNVDFYIIYSKRR